ncbi:hypothetical protein [Brevundimonas sp. FT23028]|uniref:hypothetical protein n=1 Tax=Brevundimonas sp. FT23028 TaxID=3393748 RepID=UPI003B587536
MIRAFRFALFVCLLAGPARAACEDLHWESPDRAEAVTWHAAADLALVRIRPLSQGGAGDRAGDAEMSLAFTPLTEGDPEGRFWVRDTVRLSVSPPPVFDLFSFTNVEQRIGYGDGRPREVREPRNDPFSMGPDGRIADRWWTDLRDHRVSVLSRGGAASDALERMRREGSIRVEQIGRRDGHREVITFGAFGFGGFAGLWTRLQAHRAACETSADGYLSGTSKGADD